MILFRTIHGSRLYGLDNPSSDYDWYTVMLKKPTRNQFTDKYGVSTHDIVDGQDSNVKDIGTWLRECDAGVPQALEAMFSQTPEVDVIHDMRISYRTGLTAYAYYRRTMRNFAQSDTFKRRRHAVRLAFNARDLREFGRFEPRMSSYQIHMANRLATQLTTEELVDAIDEIAFGDPI